MRYSKQAIRQILSQQIDSGESVATFCISRGIKVATFYSWRRKYEKNIEEEPEGFCKIVPRREARAKSISLPSGVRLEMEGFTIAEIADLLLEIDRAYV